MGNIQITPTVALAALGIAAAAYHFFSEHKELKKDVTQLVQMIANVDTAPQRNNAPPQNNQQMEMEHHHQMMEQEAAEQH